MLFSVEMFIAEGAVGGNIEVCDDRGKRVRIWAEEAAVVTGIRSPSEPQSFSDIIYPPIHDTRPR